jgi:hypothetical protein
MPSGFNLAGLAAWTDETSQGLISRAVLSPATAQNVTIMPGLQAGTVALNILGANLDIKDYACGFGAGQVGNNTVIYTQKNITIATKMVKNQFCPNDLRAYWLSSQMSASGYQETIPFEQAIGDYMVRRIAAANESYYWQGDGSTVNGLQDEISIASGSIDGSAFAAGLGAASTAFAAFWGLIDELAATNPAVLQQEDLTAYVSMPTYSRLVQSLQLKGNALIQQYNNVSNVSGMPQNQFVWPGTSVTVVGLGGISDTGSPSIPYCAIGPKSQVFLGVGLQDDADRLRIYYNEAEDFVNLLAAYRFGVQAISDQFIVTK